MDIIMDTPKLRILPEHLKLISEIDEFKGKWLAGGGLQGGLQGDTHFIIDTH